MSTIDRYKKHGGFLQLLKLIETSGTQKQEKFLAMIREESPVWEAMLKKKMLTIQKIFSWSDAVLAEVVTRLQPITLALAFHGLPEETINRVLNPLGVGFRRKIEEFKQTSAGTPVEISAAYAKIITEVREMAAQGIIRFEKFAPDLMIDENIEEKLQRGEYRIELLRGEGSEASIPSASPVEVAAPPTKGEELVFHLSTPDPHSVSGKSASSDEVERLKKQVTNLHSENEALKKEIHVLKDKLTQIRKIA